jgi:hypothetical protein
MPVSGRSIAMLCVIVATDRHSPGIQACVRGNQDMKKKNMRETTLPAARVKLTILFFHTNSARLIWLAGLALMAVTGIYAQHETDYKVHANIIYRFTKYIDWPADKKVGDFIIGTIGETQLYDDLKSLCANKMVGSQKIVIVKMSPSASSYVCHILFISEEESSSLKRIAGLTAGLPILIISESDGLARKGACINFITVDEHLKLEINKNSAEQRNLHIASELLQLGIIVK